MIAKNLCTSHDKQWKEISVILRLRSLGQLSALLTQNSCDKLSKLGTSVLPGNTTPKIDDENVFSSHPSDVNMLPKIEAISNVSGQV